MPLDDPVTTATFGSEPAIGASLSIAPSGKTLQTLWVGRRCKAASEIALTVCSHIDLATVHLCFVIRPGIMMVKEARATSAWLMWVAHLSLLHLP